MSYRILPYSQDHKKSLFRLLKYMWKGFDDEDIQQKFEWRYEENPAQDRPYIFIAIDNENEIVGFRAFVVQEFCICSKTIKVFNPADAIIHPDHRRKGLFSKLTNALIKQISDTESRGIILSLSSNEKSASGNLKLGWIRTNGQKNYAYKISPQYFIKNSDKTIENKIISSTTKGKIIISNVVETEQILTFEKDTVNQLSFFQNCRSKDYYKWRYEQIPDSDNFYSAYLRTDHVDAYLILKKISSYQFRLEEYDAHSVTELRILVEKVVGALNIPILRVWMINNSDHELLSKCGFIRETSCILKLVKKERSPVLVRPTVEHPLNRDFIYDGIDIRDMNNWRIQKADSH